MLTRLRFKNWRSLKDVTIDNLTPLTVFIGANSSGKTNILEGLRFYRDSLRVGLVQTVSSEGYDKIQTNALDNDEDVELEFSLQLPEISTKPITEKLQLSFHKRSFPFDFGSQLLEGS